MNNAYFAKLGLVSIKQRWLAHRRARIVTGPTQLLLGLG